MPSMNKMNKNIVCPFTFKVCMLLETKVNMMVADAVLQQSTTVLQLSYPAPVCTGAASQSSSSFSGSTRSKMPSPPSRDRDPSGSFWKWSELFNSSLLALGFLIKEASASPLICHLLTLPSKSKSRDVQLVQNSKSAYLRSGVTDIFFFPPWRWFGSRGGFILSFGSCWWLQR